MSRDQWLILASVLIPIAIIATLMVLGWRARRHRQADVRRPASPPAELGTLYFSEDMLYVATTRAAAPLDRIAVAGLGFRARAVVTVAAAGIQLELAGQQPAFLPTDALDAAGRASWTIDRAISKEGLVFVRWSQTGTDGTAASFDSYFRPTDPATMLEALEKIVPAPAATDSAGAAV